MIKILVTFIALSLFNTSAHANSVFDCLVNHGNLIFSMIADLKPDAGVLNGNMTVSTMADLRRVSLLRKTRSPLVPYVAGHQLEAAFNASIKAYLLKLDRIPAECEMSVRNHLVAGEPLTSFSHEEFTAILYFLSYNNWHLSFTKFGLASASLIGIPFPVGTSAHDITLLEEVVENETVEDLFRKALKKANQATVQDYNEARVRMRDQGLILF